MAVKKNPDYTASAVNLCNPEPLAMSLNVLRSLEARILEVQAEVDSSVPQYLRDLLSGLTAQHMSLRDAIKVDIDHFGSYQDVESGFYAVKQRKESITYQPGLVRQTLPLNVANLVIVEAVDVKKLDGLIKGGIVTAEEAEKCGEVRESFAYIIR